MTAEDWKVIKQALRENREGNVHSDPEVMHYRLGSERTSPKPGSAVEASYEIFRRQAVAWRAYRRHVARGR